MFCKASSAYFAFGVLRRKYNIKLIVYVTSIHTEQERTFQTEHQLFLQTLIDWRYCFSTNSRLSWSTSVFAVPYTHVIQYWFIIHPIFAFFLTRSSCWLGALAPLLDSWTSPVKIWRTPTTDKGTSIQVTVVAGIDLQTKHFTTGFVTVDRSIQVGNVFKPSRRFSIRRRKHSEQYSYRDKKLPHPSTATSSFSDPSSSFYSSSSFQPSMEHSKLSN